jgi:hypothetical protein
VRQVAPRSDRATLAMRRNPHAELDSRTRQALVFGGRGGVEQRRWPEAMVERGGARRWISTDTEVRVRGLGLYLAPVM